MLQNFRKAYLPYNHFFLTQYCISFIPLRPSCWFVSNKYNPTSRSPDEQYYILEVVNINRQDMTLHEKNMLLKVKQLNVCSKLH